MSLPSWWRDWIQYCSHGKSKLGLSLLNYQDDARSNKHKIVMLVLVFYLCPSSVRVVANFPGTVLFPLLCSVLPFFA